MRTRTIRMTEADSDNDLQKLKRTQRARTQGMIAPIADMLRGFTKTLERLAAANYDTDEQVEATVDKTMDLLNSISNVCLQSRNDIIRSMARLTSYGDK